MNLADGYRVFRGIVPPRNVAEAVRAVCDFAGVDLENRESWYGLPAKNAGVVPLHHAQAFWDNRQHPDLHAAFAEIYGHDDLWVTMDRAAFRPPARDGQEAPDDDGWHRSLGNLHWDSDPRLPHPGRVQGVLLLTDTPAEAGGFQCAPGIYRDLKNWIAKHPGFRADTPGIEEREIVHVTGQAGDLIVWDAFLPHGPATNLARGPRIAQYISMTPIVETDRDARIALVEQKRAPEWWRGLVGQRDPEPGPPTRLTPLGRRLVGY